MAKYFQLKGASVKVLVRDETHFRKFQQLGMSPVLGDLTDRDSLVEAVKDCDYVIHCAAYLGDEMDIAIASNVIGVENLASVH